MLTACSAIADADRPSQTQRWGEARSVHAHVRVGMCLDPYRGRNGRLPFQLDGFTVSYYDTVLDSHELVALDRNASVIAATGTSSRVVWPVAAPLGGIVVLGRVNDTSPIGVAAYDERLNQRFRTQLSSIER